MRAKVFDVLHPELTEHGTNQYGGADNANLNSPFGNLESYTISRLKRDRPDLAKKVIDGKLTANAAAIEAGFRKKTAAGRIVRGGAGPRFPSVYRTNRPLLLLPARSAARGVGCLVVAPFRKR
jgi:hypothetical protein